MLVLVTLPLLTLYSLIDQFILFLGRPTATTVNVETENNGLSFPAVTVCNLNPVLRSYAEENNITELLDVVLRPDIQQFVHNQSSSNCNAFLV